MKYLSRKSTWVYLCTFLLALAIPLAAWADDISNNLDASVDAIAEVMPLNVGGANGTTQLYIVTANGDGKNGCNLTGSTTLVVSVSSSKPGVATVSPNSVTFTSCGDTRALTVTPVSQGSADITLTQTGNNTGATFDLSTAKFTVNVAPPPPSNTAPQVTINGVSAGVNYEIGSVPAATCNVTDLEDGNSSFAATLSAVSGPLAAYGLGEQTASCSYTDGGGLTASASVTYGIVDTTAPVITFVSRTAANANGWNNADVTVTWSCSDSGSGVVNASLSQTVSAEGTDQSATGTCEDHAGNTVSDTQNGINIDKTVPTANASASPAANANLWNNTDVTVSFSGSDGLSGIDFCAAAVTLGEGANQSASGTCTDKAGNVSAAATASGINIDKTAPVATATAAPAANSNGWNNTDVTVSFNGTDNLSGIAGCTSAAVLSSEGAGQSASGTCTDKAGNVSAQATAKGINIDKTAPPVALVGGLEDGATYYFGFVPAAPTCSASDALSGLDGVCSVSGYSNAIGSQTVTASATDKAGNSGTVSATYTVKAWTVSGFYQPVDMNGVVNTVKNGSTVPLKFELFAGSTELTNTSYVVSFTAKQVACSGGLEDSITLAETGATSLRYDSVAGQFIFNWQTPKKAGYCYTVTGAFQDGSSLVASFKLK